MIQLVESASCLADGCDWHTEGPKSQLAAHAHQKATGHPVRTGYRPQEVAT